MHLCTEGTVHSVNIYNEKCKKADYVDNYSFLRRALSQEHKMGEFPIIKGVVPFGRRI